MIQGCRSLRRVGGTVALGVLALPALVVPTFLAGPPGAGASSTAVGPLEAVGCSAVKGEPAVAAPSYAQTEGASTTTSGWWCQLPHPTKLPKGLVAASRVVDPLPNTYARFTTEYLPKTTGGSSSAMPGAPSIYVSPEVDSAVIRPGQLDYGRQPAGRTVVLGHGVRAVVTSSKQLVSVRWRYPTTGVPKYLQGVATVTVTGKHLPVATVVAVARAVRPD